MSPGCQTDDDDGSGERSAAEKAVLRNYYVCVIRADRTECAVSVGLTMRSPVRDDAWYLWENGAARSVGCGRVEFRIQHFTTENKRQHFLNGAYNAAGTCWMEIAAVGSERMSRWERGHHEELDMICRSQGPTPTN